MEDTTSKKNVYAYNIKNIVKYISEVESGRKGYYCIGCGKEMQARKGDILMHHFSHDPKDVQNLGKCSYSDETYRHQLAKEILQRIKQIKVPSLYKYPPEGIDGKPNKLKDTEFIHADSVSIELTFYEDEAGRIVFGKDFTVDSSGEKFLLIRPDVTFFDSNGTPILLIEIVATHKINADKISKIKKLGINTIQVTLPKDSPEEIENTFFKTTRTQWIYNYDREQTEYIPISEGTSEGIPSIDEFQRILLKAAESYECRAAQINNLIRGLNKSLDAQQYRKFIQDIGDEIRRVEGNTERIGVELREVQEGLQRSIKEEFRMEEEDVARQEGEVSEKSKEFDREASDYEARYYSKRESLERLQKEYRSEFEPEIERITREFERFGTDAVNFRRRGADIKREAEQLEQQYRSRISNIEEQTRAAAEHIEKLERRRGSLQNQYQSIEETVRGDFDRDRRRSIEAIEKRDSIGISRVSRRLGDIRETREQLKDIAQAKINLRRMRKFKEIFDSGAYKSWP